MVRDWIPGTERPCAARPCSPSAPSATVRNSSSSTCPVELRGARLVDTLLVNGRVATLDGRTPTASAIAISDGEMTATGDDQEILARRTPQTTVIDLGRRTVIPG